MRGILMARVIIAASCMVLGTLPLCAGFHPSTNTILSSGTNQQHIASRASSLRMVVSEELCDLEEEDNNNDKQSTNNSQEGTMARRSLLLSTRQSLLLPALWLSTIMGASPLPVQAKCTDMESCREAGDKKRDADLKENPVTRLPSGVRYKVLQKPPLPNSSSSSTSVQEGSSIDLIYTVSRAGGQYMYSQGFGFELVDPGVGSSSGLQKDLGLDRLRVTVGHHQQVPIGIEQALVGMKVGERRRVELDPKVGLETSNWLPTPTTARGQQATRAYRRVLEGFGSAPPFAALTVWDIEVTKIRN